LALYTDFIRKSIKNEIKWAKTSLGANGRSRPDPSRFYGDIFLRPFVAGADVAGVGADPPRTFASFCSSDAICSLMAIACFRGSSDMGMP
jgi:hypothetical protein